LERRDKMANIFKQPELATEKVPDTLGKFLLRNYLQWPDRIALRQKDFGIWQPCNWKECYTRAKEFALGLLSLGFQTEDRLIFIGDNEFESYWGMYGTLAIGGVVVGVWVDALAEEVAYYLKDCKPRFALVRDQEQIDKLLSIRAEDRSSLEKAIYWEPRGMNEPMYVENPWIMSFQELTDMGRGFEKGHENAFEQSIYDISGGARAAMYYTSGTTGGAKGVVRTHYNQIALGESLQRYFPVQPEDELVCAYPVASIGEPILGSVRNLMHGATLHFPELPETIFKDTREIGPKYLGNLPRQWEDIASMMRTRIDDANWLKRGSFYLGLKFGYRNFDRQLEGKVTWWWKYLYGIIHYLTLRPNLDRAGLSRVKAATTAGFVLGAHTFRFLNACGLHLREFYASTEVPSIATQLQGNLRPRSVGRAMEGIEIRVMNDQELYIRGALRFDHYYNREEATRKAIDDKGWFHSGDAGYVDDDGFIFFMDRVSELALMADGTKYSPQFIESELRFGAYVKDGWVIGENKPFITAVVTIDMESVARWAEKRGISFTTQVELSQKDEVSRKVVEDINLVNQTLPEKIRIRKYIVLHKEFDPDEAELTRTRKLRRKYLFEKYRMLDEALYQDKNYVDVEASFKYYDGTTSTVGTRIRVRTVEEEQGKPAID
jgi:long-chain acyl-CoA synthetase